MLCASDESSARILGQKGWLFELKLDGVRIVAEKEHGKVALAYRKSRDATESYSEIAEAVRALAIPDVILDGEIVAFDDEGRPDFQKLASRIQSRGRGKTDIGIVYVVFDVLAIGDDDVRNLPIEARKELLSRLIPEGARAIRLHPTFDDGKKLFALCREHGLEGVVAKRAGSVYRSGDRSPDWVKVKHDHDAEFVVVGWTEGEGKRARLGALDLASYEGDRLVLRGAVGSGLDEDTIDRLLALLAPLASPTRTAEGRFTSMGKNRHHVKPELVVSVRYTQFTSDSVLRHSVFRGLRPDVEARDCTASPSGGEARIQLTGQGKSEKDAFVGYYERIWDALSPHLLDRPCALIGKTGVLWPLPKWTPGWVKMGRRSVVVDSIDVVRFAIEAGCHGLSILPGRESVAGRADFVAFRGDAAFDVATRIGLRAYRFAGDVVVPLGGAPLVVANALGALMAKLAGAELLAGIAAPWSIVVHEGVARVAAPFAAAPVPFEAALARLDEDPLRYAFEEDVDVASAIAALEKTVLDSRA